MEDETPKKMTKSQEHILANMDLIKAIIAEKGTAGLDAYISKSPFPYKHFVKMLGECGIDYSEIPVTTYYNKKELKDMGWTDAAIKKFLGEADDTKVNPMYKNAAPMQLYLDSRVKAVSRTQEYKDFMSKSAARKVAAKKAVKTKHDQLMEELENIEVTVTVLPKDKLLQFAIDSYNDWNWHRDVESASKNSDKAFLDRIQVNFIRHNLTEYDEHLYGIKGRVGIYFGVDRIRDVIFEEIAKAYPYLAHECKRQHG